MKTWALGICMLVVFAALSQSGRLALEILLSVVFTTAFFLSLLHEVAQRNMKKHETDSHRDEGAQDTKKAENTKENDEMPLAA